MRIKLVLAFAVWASVAVTFAQEKAKIRFGKITPDDFRQTAYSLDSSANAMVIADIGFTEIVGNSKGGFSLEFKKFQRAHILNKNGYDIATVEITLYTNGNSEQELVSLKAVSYNMENGRVAETKLDVKGAVFRDKINKHWVTKKFTLPNIKQGSIIEYEYKIKSDFIFNLRPWEFQGSYPCLWSEYNASIPEFLNYVTLTQGYLSFYINEKKERIDNFSVSDNHTAGATDRSNFSAGVTDFRWVMKDVPALKEESFTSTIGNHLAKIQFQLSELKHPYIPKKIMGTWEQACEDLLKSEDFGDVLTRDNSWLNDVMKEATGQSVADLGKARNIYSYVRDHLTCTDYNQTSLEKPLRSVLRERSGNEAEINLLLTAMLLKAGLKADPVLLSTRSHGYTYAMYPLMDRFNYVICRVELEGKYYYLDASKPRMGFGRLAVDSYNGHARVINEVATPVDLVADSLTEKKITSVFVTSDAKGNLSGSIHQTPGFYESYSLRGRIQEIGKDQLFNDFKKGFNGEVEIKKTAIDSLHNYDEALRLRYEFDMQTAGEDIIYFNPMLGEAWKENPFKSAKRVYPVEMPYTIDETYLLHMDVPNGYVIDEMPKQEVVKLNDADDGMFEFRISESGGAVLLRSRIRLKRAFFLPEEYETLRQFFNLVVKKHSEQIVFKRKK